MQIFRKSNLLLLFGLISFNNLAQNPGNVSSNLQLWLKSDVGALNGGLPAIDGQAVNTWQDQTTARTNDATDTDPILEPPTYRHNVTDNINYNPVIDFDGLNDGLNFGNDYIYSSGVGGQDGMTFFAVVQPDASVSKSLQYVFDFGFYGNRGYGFMYGSSHYLMYSSVDYSGASSGTVSHTYNTATKLVRYTVDFGVDQTVNIDGTNTAATTNIIGLTALTATQINEGPNNTGGNGPFTIGHQSKSTFTNSNGGRRLDGSLAEIIGYNTDLLSAAGGDIARIESYLAVKYAITLDNAGGGTNGDYTSSDGTTIWDASLQPSYQNDIIAIARDDNEGLLQKQSHTFSDSTRIYLDVLQNTNMDNIGSFSVNNSYVVMGDNQGALCATLSSNTEMPTGLAGCTLYSRLEREWKVTKSNFSQDFNAAISIAGCAIPGMVNTSDLRLLIDDDGDFSNGGTTCYFNGDGSGIILSYGIPGITITNISPSMIPDNSTRYITIASAALETPLPIELLSFSANTLDNRTVKLDWQTASEINNDYFTLERSINVLEWEELMTIEGAGNSSNLLTYTEMDYLPFSGTSYYRLKQTDFDGQYSYSQIRSVNLESLSDIEIKIFPNPTKNEITITGSSDELEEVKIYNTLGQDVTAHCKIVKYEKSKRIIDLSGISVGMYYITTKTTANKVYKQ